MRPLGIVVGGIFVAIVAMFFFCLLGPDEETTGRPAVFEKVKEPSLGDVKEVPMAHGARLMAAVPIERLTPAQAKDCERVQGEIWSTVSTNGHVEICVIPKAAGNGFDEKWAACEREGGMPVRYGGLHILCGL